MNIVTSSSSKITIFNDIRTHFNALIKRKNLILLTDNNGDTFLTMERKTGSGSKAAYIFDHAQSHPAILNDDNTITQQNGFGVRDMNIVKWEVAEKINFKFITIVD